MSLTSCFKYAVELPAASLSSLLRSVIAQGETAPLPTTYHEEDVVVPGLDYLVTVDASLVDSNEQPSSISFTATDLEAILHLFMRVEVTVQEFDGLNPIVYDASFDIPGLIAVDNSETPPWLGIEVGALQPSDLNLVVTGGEYDFTPTFFEDVIHEMYASHPEIHDFVRFKDVGPFGTRRFMVWIYDDAENPITVELPEPLKLRVHMPGKMEIWTTLNPVQKEHEAAMVVTIDIVIDEEPNASGGTDLVVKLSGVTEADIEITFTWTGPAPLYESFIGPAMKPEIVTLLSDFDDPRESVPSKDAIDEQIAAAIVQFASDSTWPLIPLDGTGTEFDLSTAVPTTVEASVLALQIEGEANVPCDGPDNFAEGVGVASAISNIETQRRLDAAADEVPNLDPPQIEGYDVTLHRPNISLEDPGEHDVAEGHFWVEGTAVVHVGGCVGDVDADYWGPLFLSVSTAPDGTVTFDVNAGEFGGDAEGKDKKEDWDPNAVKSYIEQLDWAFPTLPSKFEGIGEVTLNFDTAAIDRRGVVISGSVSVLLLNQAMLSSVLPRSAFWAMEGAHG
jgi:hypothetical protein